MQENKHPVGGVLIHYQTDIKLGRTPSCMTAHIQLQIAKSIFKKLQNND